MRLEVLSPEGESGGRWREAIEGLPPDRRDVHFTPEYGAIYQACYGFQAHLALYRSDAGHIVQPFVRRPLAALPFLAGAQDADTFSDIANAYGYGGPLCSIGDGNAAQDLYRGFAGAFAAWCDSERIASEFCSLHPLMADHQRGLMDGTLPTTYVKDVVVIDLRASEEELARGLRKGHRSSITLARRSDVRVAPVEPNAANIARFRAMYEETMVRRDAAERWFMPPEFFATTVASLGPARTSLLFATVGGDLESGCLLMHDGGTAYYHFAGTHLRHPASGANNLMVWEAAMHARRAGYKTLHLGGGVSARADDSLLRFKAGFSAGRAPLFTCFTVRNRAAYDELCARKRDHERQTAGTELESDFLPLYRR